MRVSEYMRQGVASPKKKGLDPQAKAYFKKLARASTKALMALQAAEKLAATNPPESVEPDRSYTTPDDTDAHVMYFEGQHNLAMARQSLQGIVKGYTEGKWPYR